MTKNEEHRTSLQNNYSNQPEECKVGDGPLFWQNQYTMQRGVVDYSAEANDDLHEIADAAAAADQQQ